MSDLIIIPFLVNLLILALVRYYFNHYMVSVFRSTVSYNVSNKLYRDNKSIKSSASLLLNFVFYISASFFTGYLISDYYFESKDTNLFILSFYALIVIFSVNMLNKTVNYISGKIFRLDELRREYNQNINYFNQSLGLILFPVFVLTAYTGISNIAVGIGITAVLLTYLLRIIRLIKINISKHVQMYYLFLYLCTFEIIPVLYLIKTLIIV